MKIIGSLVTALVLFGFPASAQPESVCELRTHAVSALEEQFKEKVSGRGLATANGGRMVELFVSKSGSWTILSTDVHGRSCLLAEGEYWQGLPPVVGEGV